MREEDEPMANTAASGEVGQLQQRAARPSFWDPFSILSGFLGLWNPLGAWGSSARAQTFVPAFDGRDTKDAYVLEADLPGIQESDLEMSVTGTQLSVSGRRESEELEQDGKFFCSERPHGAFVRTFTLPDDAELERASAKFQDGVLRVEIPKRPEAQARRIDVAAARRGSHGGQRQPAGGTHRRRPGRASP
jgi:HSP20 family protein